VIGSSNLKMRVCAVVTCLREGVGGGDMKMNRGVVGEGRDGGGDTVVIDV
jgi:hypothetical protein